MASLHYLTVQDILWINLQVTKKVQHFNYAKLEEATFYQYAYGESNSLLPQAARFVSGFSRMHPFEAGNEATAFIGCLVFLEINGERVTLSDDAAADWFRRASEAKSGDSDTFGGVTEAQETHYGEVRPDIKAAVLSVLSRFPGTVASLSAGRETAARS